MSKIKGLIFDLDGVLVNTKKIHFDALNLALKKTNGDYVSFLDTDDWWHNERLMKQVEVLRKNNEIKFIYSKYLTYNQTKKKLFNNFKSRLTNNYYNKLIAFK